MTTILVIGCALLAAYYPVMLFLRSDYRANPAIRAQFGFSIIVALTLSLGVYRQLVAPPPDWARFSVFLLIFIGLAWQAVALTSTQNRRAARIARERREVREALKEKR